MKSLFITGTDTEIGKTFVTCGMLTALRRQEIHAAPMKPIAAGTTMQQGQRLNEDVHQLIAAYAEPIDATLVNPFCFDAAIAPHIAAVLEKRSVDLDTIDAAFAVLKAAHDCVLVEGAGGFLVPLSDTQSMATLPTRLGLDVVLVVGMRLGCLNHALLTAEAIHSRGLTLAGWVANTVDAQMRVFDENVGTLRTHLNAPCLGVIPRIDERDTIQAAARCADHLQIDALAK